MTRAYRFLGLFVVLSIMAAGADAADMKYRIRKRICQLEDNCPTNDGSSAGPTGYTARIDQDPVTGANQSLVSFTISGAQAGDLFNWTLDDTNSGTSALSGNGSMSGTSFRVSGVNASSLSDGTLILRVEVSRGGIWGNPVTDTAVKDAGVAVFVSFDDGFDDATASAVGQPLTSNTITVSGFAGSLNVSVSGDSSAQVSINGGACAASGTIDAGQTISLCANSPALDTTKTITVSVGSSSANWKISTGTSSLSGQVYFWGVDHNGEWGPDLGEAEYLSPVAITDLSGGLTAISKAYDHTCVIQNGAAKCWGHNNSGALGDGTNNPESTTPVQVVGLTSGVTAISAGQYYTSCAVHNGAAKCWGSNTFGELGNGLYTDSNVPVQVTDLTSGVTGVASSGVGTTCAIHNGAAKCWGANGAGQLGDGTYDDSTAPVQVLDLTSGVTAIDTEQNTGCAIHNGAVKCWGINDYGQLGNTAVPYSNVPVQVGGLASGVTAIDVGTQHVCAIHNGAAKCWGRNNVGQLGNGTTSAYSTTPVQVMDLTSGVLAISAGGGNNASSCAVHNGAAKCWGTYPLGDGTVNSSNVPVQVTGLASDVAGITVGSTNFCAITEGSGLPSDTTGPTISTLSPQPGSTEVAEDANLVITFGENVVKGTGNIVIRKLADGSALETIPVTDARVTIAGKVATINPTGLFASNTVYYVEVATGAFKDGADNAFAGIAGSATWAFTSEITDFAPPLVSTLSPAHGATGVAVAANLVITFDEPVVKGSGNIVIKKTSDNTAFETIPVSDARVSVSGNAATINPTGTFASLTGYYVEVAAGAFKDASANAYAGITGSGTWAFTSVSGATYASCQDAYADGQTTSGNYMVDLDGTGGMAPFAARCLMSGGKGWLLVAARRNTITNTLAESVGPNDWGKALTVAKWQYIKARASKLLLTNNADAQTAVVDMAAANSANCVPILDDLSTDQIVHSENDACAGGGLDYCTIGNAEPTWNLQAEICDICTVGRFYDVGPSGGGCTSGAEDLRIYAWMSGDVAAPTVSSLYPSDGATNAATGLSLSITFSENVVKGAGDIILKKSSDNSVVETIPVTDAKVSIAGAVATIAPDVILAANTGYYVQVAAGAFKDAADNPYAGIANATDWNFTTAPLASYMMCSEPDSSWQLLHNFSSGATPTLRWNAAQANNGTQNGVTKYSPSVYNFPYNVYAAMSGGGWSSAGYLQITMPTGGNEFLLCYGNNHSSGTVNIARNVYSTILDSHSTYVVAKLYQGTYTPGDRIIVWEDSAQTLSYWMFIRNSNSPAIQTLSPANGSASAAGDANLVITFSETVVKGTGNIVIRKSSDNTVVETIAVSDAKVSVSGAEATINPAATLDPETGYYVEASAGAFEDASGNDFAGLYGSTHWHFTTGTSVTPWPNPGEPITTLDRNTGGTLASASVSVPVEISPDGRYVVFGTTASLDPADVDSTYNVYLHDLQTRATTMLNIPGFVSSMRFTGGVSTNAQHIVIGYPGAGGAVYVHDRTAGTLERADINPPVDVGLYACTYGTDISNDGNLVAFICQALIGGTISGVEVFVHDRSATTTVRASRPPAGGKANGNSWGPRISGDGHYLTFTSFASNLVSGGTTTGLSSYDVFIRDLTTSLTQVASKTDGDVDTTGHSSYGQSSDDGRYVAFWSDSTNMVAGDTNASTDVFLRDRTAGTTTRVSVQDDDSQSFGTIGSWAGSGWIYGYPTKVSNDGRYVVFPFGNLTSDRTNFQLYVRDTVAGTTTALFPDVGDGVSFENILLDTTPDGSIIVFVSSAGNLMVTPITGTHAYAISRP